MQIDTDTVELAMEVNYGTLQFFYKKDGEWVEIGPVLDGSVVSDEGGRGEHGSFTGAFAGMISFDMTGRAKEAEYEYFNYIPA